MKAQIRCDIAFRGNVIIIRFWLIVPNFRATIPMKLNAPGDLLFEQRVIFNPVSIMQPPKDFL